MNSQITDNGQSRHNPKFDDWAFMLTVLSGPLTVILAAVLAVIATVGIKDVDRSKELMQFATLLFGGGAAVTGTNYPRKSASSSQVAIDKVDELNANVEQTSNTTNNSSHSQREALLPAQDLPRR